MPTTPIYALRYPALADPADVPTDMGELATDVEGAIRKAGIIYGTSPPASPADGDLWCFPADASTGVMWLFRYRAASASAYKWEFVGGSELKSNPGNINFSFTSSSYVAVTGGPTIAISRAGEYRIEIGGFVYAIDNTTSRNALVAPDGAGLTAADANAIQVTLSSGTGFSSAMTKPAAVALTAAGTLATKAKTSGQTSTLTYPWLSVLPFRVS